MQGDDGAGGAIGVAVGQGAAKGVVFIHTVRKSAGKEHIDNRKGFVDFKVINGCFRQLVLG